MASVLRTLLCLRSNEPDVLTEERRGTASVLEAVGNWDWDWGLVAALASARLVDIIIIAIIIIITIVVLLSLF